VLPIKINSAVLTQIKWVLKPENSLVWHKEVFGWINKYSGLDKEQENVHDDVDVKLWITS
jgi:hypothetical protein